MHVLLNTRAITHYDERRTAKQPRSGKPKKPRSGRDRPWAAKQQAARLIWPGEFMNLYTIKYHALNLLYYIAIVVRGLLVVVLAPLNFIFEALYTIASEWEPSKPLHKSKEIDYDNPDNYGI